MNEVRYGGQAIIEGVMMRGGRVVVSAVRSPSGHIVTQTEHLRGLVYEKAWARWPIVRGPLNLWDTLLLGIRALLFSANIAIDEEEEKPTSGVIWGTMALSLAMAVGVFFVLPALVAGTLDPFIRSSFEANMSSLVSNFLEKALRLGLLIGYIYGIGFMPDIRRVFAYHGAEHKAVNAFEAGAPLEVAHVKKYSTSHPRCGTSFLLVVVVVSFVLFLLLGQPPLVERIVSRIVLIPIVAAIAYELIRVGAAHQRNRLVRLLLLPGLAMQSLTTREPDEHQIEVALAALKSVIAQEQAIAAEPAPSIAPAPG
ncbi:MAG: DUF1385 domain-containing protein [Bacteroidetes bacterium]|nr:DUF1385 domain-containing protein [Bacteroidota bacterium]MCL5026282.1 DUF1385 domain-containing protein [Chloroflexota bacterium]